MQHRPVASIFLRHSGDILLVKRSQAVSSYPGKWGTVAGHIEATESLIEAVSREITEETELTPDDWSLERTGEPFTVTDASLDVEWQIHPVLVSTSRRDIAINWETAEYEWTSPEAIHTRETVPDLWKTYERVRPTVETIREDREHGSAWLSIRALEVLRDEAIRAQHVQPVALVEVATALCNARPTMAVLTNRINRVMSECLQKYGDLPPANLSSSVHEAIFQALSADTMAAKNCAPTLADKRVATLSRSGTVLDALIAGEPEAVLIAESRPGREGVVVAERFCERLNSTRSITLTTDAAFPGELHEWDADILLVGADAVLADGRVVNKVGTHGAMAAASESGIDCLVVATIDKIRWDTEYDRELRPTTELYDGPAAIECVNPTFDVTPERYIDALITEDGELTPTDTTSLATEHQRNARWQDNI